MKITRFLLRVSLLTLIMLSAVDIKPRTARDCATPKTPDRADVDPSSGVVVDLVIAERHDYHSRLMDLQPGDFLPWLCALASNATAEACYFAWNIYTGNYCVARDRARGIDVRSYLPLKKRSTLFQSSNGFNDFFDRSIARIMMQVRAVMTSSTDQEKLDRALYTYFNYCETIQRALFMRDTTSNHYEKNNYQEQAARALVDELIRARKEGLPENYKLHKIEFLRTSDFCSRPCHEYEYHPAYSFVVSGSTTLTECKIIKNPDAMSTTLSQMDGTVIDYSNGGICLPASQAREQFNLYGPNATVVFGGIRIIEFSTKNIRTQIETMDILPEVKSILLDNTGPTLDEIEQRRFISSPSLY